MLKPIDESRLDEFEVNWKGDSDVAYVTYEQKNILTFFERQLSEGATYSNLTVARPHVLDLVLQHADNYPDPYTDRMVQHIEAHIQSMDREPEALRREVNQAE